jgi:hypothetical protein
MMSAKVDGKSVLYSPNALRKSCNDRKTGWKLATSWH